MGPARDGLETGMTVPAATVSGPEELLVAAASGDAAAFEKLYREFAPRVLSFLGRRSSDRSVLGDLLQDVFLAVWRKAALFKPGYGSAEQWIFTIARHKLYDAWRQVARLREDLLDPAGDQPLGRIEPQDSGVELLSLVERLEPNQRQVVKVFYFDGLTMEEGAARLRTPLGTFKSRLHKALENLRIHFATGEGS